MTRRMLDALFPNDIPLAAALPGNLIAAYLGHASNPQSYAQAVARFPGHQIVSIASTNAVDAQILDVERGAVDPSDFTTMNTWCARQRARGVTPTIYCNVSTWPGVYPHIVGPVNWWAANWNNGPVIPSNSVGVQYSGQPGFDISVLIDYIAGIDTGDSPSGGGVIVTTPTDASVGIDVWYGQRVPAGKQYAGAVFGDIVAGNAAYVATVLPQIVTQLTAIQGALSSEQTALLAAIQGVATGSTDAAAIATAVTAAVTAALPAADAAAVLAALKAAL